MRGGPGLRRAGTLPDETIWNWIEAGPASRNLAVSANSNAAASTTLGSLHTRDLGSHTHCLETRIRRYVLLELHYIPPELQDRQVK